MKRSPRLSPMLAAWAALMIAAPAHADWPTGGRALCTQPNHQFLPALVSDGSGGAIAAWGDFRLSEFWIYADRVQRNGFIASGWPVDGAQAANFNLTSYMTTLRGASDGAGGAYFAWGGGDTPTNHLIWVQHVTGAGAVAAGWPAGGLVVDTVSTTSPPRIAPDGAGGVLVCWNDEPDLRIQRVQADGSLSPGWPAAGARVTNVSGNYGDPYVVGDGSGGAVVAWTDSSGSGGGDVRAQRIDAGGAAAAGWPADGIVVCGEAGAQNVFQPIADGAGGAWFEWTDDRNLATSGRDVYTQRITGSGTPAAGWPADGLAACDATGNQGLPRLASDGSDGAYLIWVDRHAAFDGDPFIQHLSADGTPSPGWPVNGMALCNAPGFEQFSLDAIVSDEAGGVIVVWSDARDSLTTGRDVYAQRVDAGGSLHAGWPTNGVPLCQANGDQTDVHCVSDGSGGAIVVWQDARTGDPQNYDIYAIGVRGDGSTPVNVALVRTAVADDRVSLEWYAAAGLPGGAMIERRTEGSSWTAIAPARADGVGSIRFDDREVVRGARYGYRLGAAGAALTAETWVQLPEAKLSVLAAAADARGQVGVSFSLASDGPAKLQLFDVAGRCVGVQAFAGLGSGDHQAQFPGALSSGLYWLRLTQDGASVRRKVFVSR